MEVSASPLEPQGTGGEDRHPCGLDWAAGLQTGLLASVPVQAWSSGVISASLQVGIQVSQLSEAFTIFSGQNKKPETCKSPDTIFVPVSLVALEMHLHWLRKIT